MPQMVMHVPRSIPLSITLEIYMRTESADCHSSTMHANTGFIQLCPNHTQYLRFPKALTIAIAAIHSWS